MSTLLGWASRSHRWARPAASACVRISTVGGERTSGGKAPELCGATHYPCTSTTAGLSCSCRSSRVGRIESEKQDLMPSNRLELPQGTLDLLILKTVALEPQHGWAISQRLHQISSATLEVKQGSLYPALHRLERRGWIKARWGISEKNRRAKYYELTSKGRARL